MSKPTCRCIYIRGQRVATCAECNGNAAKDRAFHAEQQGLSVAHVRAARAKQRLAKQGGQADAHAQG